MICDASFPTFLLQSWVRDGKGPRRMAAAQAVKALADEPARLIGLADRGRLAPGYVADVNVIDLDRLTLGAPRVVYDLPAGGRRLRQDAEGYEVTVKRGVVTYRDGEPTGALPGGLVRGAQLAPAAADLALA
jgi:N-acyl-D-aspartate/D-glutamate deacylase